jgi:transcriptional regulator with XRE-family HTH domain
MADSQRREFERRARDRVVGQLVADARGRAHLSQAQVAARLGYSQSRVAKFEIGARRLTLIDADDLARVLGVAVTDLLPPPKEQTRSVD